MHPILPILHGRGVGLSPVERWSYGMRVAEHLSKGGLERVCDDDAVPAQFTAE